MRIEGACHCGELSFSLETRRSRAEIEPRACDCAFCTRHGAQCWSDPEGNVEIRVRDGRALQRYRFGCGTADFLVCRRCGVYLGALITDGDAQRATLNLRLTALRDLAATVVSYQSESRAERVTRRLARWTPARLQITE
jgi:hypothetical protein